MEIWVLEGPEGKRRWKKRKLRVRQTDGVTEPFVPAILRHMHGERRPKGKYWIVFTPEQIDWFRVVSERFLGKGETALYLFTRNMFTETISGSRIDAPMAIPIPEDPNARFGDQTQRMRLALQFENNDK